MMKGLILKDLYLLKGLGKQFGLVFGFLMLWSIMVKSFEFLIIYVVIMCGSLVMSTMSYDESVSFNRFALTMPINIKTLVRAKYVLFILILLAAAGIGVLLNIILPSFWNDSEQAFEWSGIAAAVAVFMMSNSISLPVMFKVGVEKARYVYILCMLLVGGFMAGSVFLIEKMGFSFQQLEEMVSDLSISALLFVIAAVAMGISYFISVKVASSKEW
ncbi:MAG: ABC-2 transporter permease [Lachnospiraceae bacterium]|nr:ABC-2 transporter permease [Lachnospiraceae bacterium]